METSMCHICVNCIQGKYLQTLISRKAIQADCHYCGKRLNCLSLGSLAEIIEAAFDECYRQTSAAPNALESAMMSDRESDYRWSRIGDPVVCVIMEVADIPESVAKDIRVILEDKHENNEPTEMSGESEFASDSHYEVDDTDDRKWLHRWTEFENSLKLKIRFFNSAAHSVLDLIFSEIESLTTSNGCKIILDAGPGTSIGELYRARAFESMIDLEVALKEPESHLGPPPSALARAGRMNAHGISVFYGATSSAIAIAEIRPPVGSRVAVARFHIIRKLRLLDITALDFATFLTLGGSILDPDYVKELERVNFIRSLGRKVCRPVTPYHEPLEYLSTQAISDYLSQNSELNVDGIIFQSAQSPSEKKNVILFHEASGVEAITRVPGTESIFNKGYDEEGEWHVDYSVIETVPRDPIPEPIDLEFTPSPDIRVPSLRIDLKSISVHHVEANTVKTERCEVSYEK